MFITGSDGIVYHEPSEGTLTGSLYRTTFVEVANPEGADEDEKVWEPGILYDTDNNVYWADSRWTTVGDSYSDSTNEGTIWVYGLNEASKSIIENDDQWVATYITSSL